MKSPKIILPILLALVLTACGNAAAATPESTPIPAVEADDIIIAEGKLEPVTYTEVSLNTSGLVSQVAVEEGDTVAAGDIIAVVQSESASTLEDAQAKATQELTTAYQEFRDAQSRLDDFDIPARFTGMTAVEAVADTLEKLNTARAEFEPYKHLDDKKVDAGEKKVDVSELSPEQLEQYFADLTSANERPVYGEARVKKKALEAAWELHRIAIKWLELETDFQNAKVRLTNAQADYDALEDTDFSLDTAGLRAILANAELRAPHAGVVTNLDLKVGEFASSGSPVMTLADMTKWIVKTSDLTEIDVVNIEEGQPVTVKLDAIPGKEFKGNILSISQDFSENQGDVVYEITILLTDFDPSMRWGMTAVVTFE